MRRQAKNRMDDEVVLTGEVIDLVPARSGGSEVRALAPLLENAMLDAEEDRCQALLTKSALEHTGALCMMADQLTTIAPGGAEHYRAIVAAYVDRATRRIGGW